MWKKNFTNKKIEPSLNEVFFTREQIRKLKYKSIVEKKLAIAHFSIGERKL